MIKVLCVDDNALVAEGMRMMIDMTEGMQCVGLAETADALEQDVVNSGADVVLLDLTMPGRDPLQALADLSHSAPGVKVIVCSGHDDPATQDAALQAGAWGYVAKTGDVMAVVDAIRTVAAGDMAVKH